MLFAEKFCPKMIRLNFQINLAGQMWPIIHSLIILQEPKTLVICTCKGSKQTKGNVLCTGVICSIDMCLLLLMIPVPKLHRLYGLFWLLKKAKIFLILSSFP